MRVFPEVVEVPGARLERWVAERHVPAVAAVAREPDAVRFLGSPAPPAAQLTTALRYEHHWERFGFGRWAIVPDGGSRRAGWARSTRCGTCGARGRSSSDGRSRGPLEARDRASAGARCDRRVLRRPGVGEVLAFIHRPNLASRAVAAGAGLQPAGSDRDPDSGAPLDVFAVGNDAWRPEAARRP